MTAGESVRDEVALGAVLVIVLAVAVLVLWWAATRRGTTDRGRSRIGDPFDFGLEFESDDEPV